MMQLAQLLRFIDTKSTIKHFPILDFKGKLRESPSINILINNPPSPVEIILRLCKLK